MTVQNLCILIILLVLFEEIENDKEKLYFGHVMIKRYILDTSDFINNFKYLISRFGEHYSKKSINSVSLSFFNSFMTYFLVGEGQGRTLLLPKWGIFSYGIGT